MSVTSKEYITEGLRFWSQKQIILRENFQNSVLNTLTTELSMMNSAWTFHRTEGPILTPYPLFSSEYTSDEIFKTDWNKGNEDFYLRAETTPSTYAYARFLINNGVKMPLCVWQVGKSFRKESNDGASPSKLRFNEFNQLEFQCIYKNTTKAEYRNAFLLKKLSDDVSRYTGLPSRIVESYRIPNYSESTLDIEVHMGDNGWKEIASCSIRNDFSEDTKVSEFAFGLDRVAHFA